VKTKILYVLLITFVLSSCSWKEYFIIKNTSNKTITITYHLEEPSKSAFPIFYIKPEAYNLNNKGNIDYDNKLKVVDNDTSMHFVNINLKPNSAMIFGDLNNDNYTKFDQYFINSRIFNLNMIKIEYGEKTIDITKKTFDEYFHKKDGEIKYTIK